MSDQKKLTAEKIKLVQTILNMVDPYTMTISNNIAIAAMDAFYNMQTAAKDARIAELEKMIDPIGEKADGPHTAAEFIIDKIPGAQSQDWYMPVLIAACSYAMYHTSRCNEVLLQQDERIKELKQALEITGTKIGVSNMRIKTFEKATEEKNDLLKVKDARIAELEKELSNAKAAQDAYYEIADLVNTEEGESVIENVERLKATLEETYVGALKDNEQLELVNAERDQLLEKVERLEKERDKMYSELLELIKKDEERK